MRPLPARARRASPLLAAPAAAAALGPRLARAGRPVLPAGRQRRLRRPPLRARPRLRPGDGVLDGPRGDHARRRSRTSTASTSTCAASRSRGGGNGRLAPRFTRDGQELVSRRAPKLRAGRPFVVTSATAACPRSSSTPTTRSRAGCPTPDGAFVVGEPQGAPGWFPANDNPRDKATLRLRDHRAARATSRWPTAAASGA